MYLDQAPVGRLIQRIKGYPASDGLLSTEQFSRVRQQPGELVKDQAHTLMPDFPLQSDPIVEVGGLAERKPFQERSTIEGSCALKVEKREGMDCSFCTLDNGGSTGE